MSDQRIKVVAFQKEAAQALAQIANKHGFALSKNRASYSDFEVRLSLGFTVIAKAEEKKQLDAKLYSGDGDPKLGDEIKYKGVTYTVTGYNRASNLLVSRKADGKSYIFKRDRFNGKFDYLNTTSPQVKTPLEQKAALDAIFGKPAKTGPRTEADILEDLRYVENSLSPENLTCDGELPRTEVRRRERALLADKARLIAELGRTPTDAELYPEIYGKGK